MEEYQSKDKYPSISENSLLRGGGDCVLHFSHLVQLHIVVFTSLDIFMQALFALPNEKTFFFFILQ